MRPLIRRAVPLLAAGSVILWCSCERHHPAELYPAQDGHQNEAAPTHESASATPTPTPANFFPTATPH